MNIRPIFIPGLLLNLFAWMAPALAYSATYYVGKHGSNNYTCTQARSASTPKLTIATGLTCLSGGDTLIIQAGTYNEGVARNAIPSGTAGARTIVRAATGETVIIKGLNSIGDAFSIYDRSYITLDGLIIDGHRLRIGGSAPGGYSHFITVQNSVIKNTANAGYPPGAQSCVTQQGPAGRNTNLQFINNDVFNCGPDSGHGIYLTAKNSLVERNQIYNIAGYGVHNYYSGAPRDASNNIIRDNYIYNADSYGILTGSGSNNKVYSNIIKGGTDPWGNPSSGGITAGFGNATNIQIYNNTIFGSDQCIYIRADARGTKVKNNLCLSNKHNTIRDLGTHSAISSNRLSTDLTLLFEYQKQ